MPVPTPEAEVPVRVALLALTLNAFVKYTPVPAPSDVPAIATVPLVLVTALVELTKKPFELVDVPVSVAFALVVTLVPIQRPNPVLPIPVKFVAVAVEFSVLARYKPS